MQLIRGIHNFKGQAASPCVLTIGNFDGVHLGHQRILARVHEKAQEQQWASSVMLFEPQPLEWFKPEQAPARIMSLRDKLTALRGYGVERVFCARFDKSFQSLSAGEFVKRVLVDGLNVRHLVVGDDFRFGSGREGDFAYLQQAGREYGFTVEDTPSCLYEGERVSSTRIRAALTQGHLEEAEALLGHPYFISGRVHHGDKLGRTLGSPTANLVLRHAKVPINGVYAVTVTGAGLNEQAAVASVGTRPTVGGKELRLEVHILNFNGDLYGRHLTVTMKHFLRPELKFDGLDALQQAIHNDIQQATQWFSDKGLL